MKTFLLLLAAALIAACALTGRTLPTADELAAATGTEAAPLRRGRASYVRECTACHRMYWPEEYPPRAWESIGPAMAERAGLGPSETRDLLRFLVTASRHARGR